MNSSLGRHSSFWVLPTGLKTTLFTLLALCLTWAVPAMGFSGNSYYWNVRDHGAVGDGEADDTEVIQFAMTQGVPIYFPPGIYRITQELSFNPTTRNAHFIGSNVLNNLVTSSAGGSIVVPGTESIIRKYGTLHI